MSKKTEKHRDGGRVVRNTAGLVPDEYQQTPLLELLSWEACYTELFLRLHPGGFRCGCGSEERIGHGRSKNNFPVYRCRNCGGVYSILTGTPLSGTTMGARELVLFMRLWGSKAGNEEMAKALGMHRSSVLQMKTKLAIYARICGELSVALPAKSVATTAEHAVEA